jgi:hypothetical protein
LSKATARSAGEGTAGVKHWRAASLTDAEIAALRKDGYIVQEVKVGNQKAFNIYENAADANLGAKNIKAANEAAARQAEEAAMAKKADAERIAKETGDARNAKAAQFVHDPEFAKIEDEYLNAKEALQEKWRANRNVFHDEYAAGNISQASYEQQLEKVNKIYYDDLNKLNNATVKKTAQFFDKESAKLAFNQEREFLLKVIGEDPELRKMAFDFKNADKQKFGKILADKLADYNCVGDKCSVDVVDKAYRKGVVGWYDNNGKITIVDKGNISLDKYMNTYTHEFGHWIDDVAPNSGVLGKQKADFGGQIYTGGQSSTYRKNLTEQSSFLKGDTEGNYFEWELAKRYGSSEQRIQAGINTIKNLPNSNPVATGVAMISTEFVLLDAFASPKKKEP